MQSSSPETQWNSFEIPSTWTQCVISGLTSSINPNWFAERGFSFQRDKAGRSIIKRSTDSAMTEEVNKAIQKIWETWSSELEIIFT